LQGDATNSPLASSTSAGDDDDEIKMMRTVTIELWPDAQGQLVAYARLKEVSTLSTLDRNRLSRKFGSDSLLTVRFAMLSASLWDKRAWAEDSAEGGRALFDADKCRMINDLRLNNLLSLDHISPHPLAREDIAWARSSELHRICKLQHEAFTRLDTIKLAGRTFSLLTATTAGVHEQRYIFTSTKIIDVIRWAMTCKSFKKLRNTPIKLALRLALLNSLSIATIEIAPERVHCVDDLWAYNATNPSQPELIMTDGCGRISRRCAERVWQMYIAKLRLGAPQDKVSKASLYEDEDASGHEARKTERFSRLDAASEDEHKRLPSAFQIRFGGYKGMLVVTDEGMGDFDIIFTKSMKKFETPECWPKHRTLEILDFSWPLSQVVFNSEILDVLYGSSSAPEDLKNHLGDQLESFLETECKELLHSVDAAFEKAIASDDYLSVKLLLAGYPPHIAFLVGFYRKTLLPLHFPIPGAHRLYGVPDQHRSLNTPQPAGVLKFNEVYLRINGTTITGEVLVLKEPCFHGSDVRKFYAVDKRELEHLENVLVFSTQGTVSPASTIAGSDLDGDKFVVITKESGLLHLVSPSPVPSFCLCVYLNSNFSSYTLMLRWMCCGCR
jgi:hypothetical protein